MLLKSGYVINIDTIGKLLKYKSYFERFKNHEKVLEYKIKEAKKINSLKELFAFCENNTDRFYEIIINDDKLIEMMINKYSFAMIGQDNLVELIKQKPQFVDEVIRKNLQPGPQFIGYIITIKKLGEIQQLISTEKYEKHIANMLRKNNRKMNSIPEEFLKSSHILKAILEVNPQLLENNIVILSIRDMISQMDDDKAIEYLKDINYPFDSRHVIDRLPVIIECIKNDHMSHPHVRHLYSKEDYLKIFNETNEFLEPEMVLENLFLIENPYFVKSLIKQGVEIDIDQLLDTRYYEEMYLELKAESIKSNIYIPRPPQYDDVIQFEGNNVFVEADSLENVIKGLKYIRENKLEQDLTIMLRQGRYDEFLITDNYEFFKELQDKNINIDFTYNSGENIYHLDKVLRNEELLRNIAEDIKSKNFSPAEEVIAVFDIVKVFKPFKELDPNQGGDTSKSRALYEYLNNNYMVCAGYADFFTNLCRRLGIKCEDIGLVIVDMEKKKFTGHARNYVNITDEKYNIDGLYVIDSTWENNGKPKVSKNEEIKSTYKHFLLTTDEGRADAASGTEISINPYDGLEGYDIWLTSQSEQELQEYFQNISGFRKERITSFIKHVMPEVFSQLEGRKLEDPENCKIIFEYLKNKVNKTYPKERLLEAILNVKKTIYENITETELEDMKMGYSLTSPFLKVNAGKWNTPEYREKYKDFMKRRLKKKDKDENSRE